MRRRSAPNGCCSPSSTPRPRREPPQRTTSRRSTCCGPSAGSLVPRGRPQPLLRARNLVLRRPSDLRFAVGASSGGRLLFLVPWQGRAIVGTSYEAAGSPPSDPLTFLEEARRSFPWAGIAPADLALVHEGLVPGTGNADGLATRGRVVDHAREGGQPGLVSIEAVK